MIRRAVLLALAAGITSAQQGVPDGVPQYVLDYAPVVYLYNEDRYRPSDIATALHNVRALNNFTPIANAPSPLTLSNLDGLNSQARPQDVYLTSDEDVTTNPAWLEGVKPDANGVTNGAISSVTVVADKGNGIVDAFYFYWYPFNWGGVLLGQRVGDHVGDWEHNCVRFKDGLPQSVWFSQHADGRAYTYAATEKEGMRPVAYSANGSHASYARAGQHDRINTFNPLPSTIFNNETAKDIKWDPVASSYFAKYDVATATFSAYDACTPLAWLNFVGRWGDKQYPDNDPRQRSFSNTKVGYLYGDGPTGPRDKRLARKNICADDSVPCTVYDNLII